MFIVRLINVLTVDSLAKMGVQQISTFVLHDKPSAVVESLQPLIRLNYFVLVLFVFNAILTESFKRTQNKTNRFVDGEY